MDPRLAVAQALDALAPAPGRWLVAVSGGTDSVALLSLVTSLGPARGIVPVAVHVDHGIQPEAAQACALVERLAGRLGVLLVVRRLALGAAATETEARRARYEVLEQVRVEQGAHGVMTAHHADDQVETVLLRLVRGTGPAGLAAMAPASGRVIRPLLGVARSELLRFAADLGLETWEDPSNRDPKHLRNWVRGEVLPLLRGRLPDIDARLADVARQAGDQRAAWDALLDRLPGLDLQEDGAPSVAVAPWLTGDPVLARQLLMAIGRRAGCRVSAEAAGRVLKVVAAGVSGRRAELGGGWSAELSFGRVVLGRPDAAPEASLLAGPDGHLRWDGWDLSWRPGRAESLSRQAFVSWFSEGPLEVGPPAPGDRIMPLGFDGRRPLVRLFQEARVARGEREHWPVFRRGGQVVWVPGVCRSALALPEGERATLEVRVERVAARPDPPYASAT